jgi:putative flippase GtrA
MTLFARWIRFNTGGLYGFVLQLLALALLSHVLPLGFATAIAVEVAVTHNFLWHEFYTWRDRRRGRSALRRFLRFQMTNGLTSIFANVVITDYLHSEYKVIAVVANVLAVIACSVINFIAGEWLVFRQPPKLNPEDLETLFI